MAWESRKGSKNRYYTRSRRENGRVVREYLGNGPEAQAAARHDAEIRERQDRERVRQSEITARFAAAERATELHYQFVEMVLHVVMEENGYHYHRGEWRKRRLPKSTAKPTNGVATEPCNNIDSDVGTLALSRGEAKPRRRTAPDRRPFKYHGQRSRKPIKGRQPRVQTRSTKRSDDSVDRSHRNRIVVSAAVPGRSRRRHDLLAPTGELGADQQPRPPPG